jgi:uncharacterized membrane protein YhaH (DUF805 family)
MFCPKCGKENSESASFCSGCGTNIKKPVTPNNTTPTGSGSTPMTFGQSIATCMGKYVDFNGRASRPEFWWFYLFTILISWASLLVDQSGMLSGIVNLAILLPVLSATVRRLHDTNRSGWWILIVFTIIGVIPYMIWLSSKGDEQSNKYGDPV